METAVDPKQILDSITEISKGLKETVTKVDEIAKSNEELRKSPFFGVPSVIKGERTGSRPYSFMKAFGLISGKIDPENAKVELDVSNRLKTYHSGYTGYEKQKSSLMLPFASSFIEDENLAEEIRELTKGGSFDLDELRYMRKKMKDMGMMKALSWIDDTTGGALVAPPAMGEFIDLLRNNEVFIRAGARVLPLPPQGRITYPRQTSAMTAYHVGESQSITSSDIGTGDVILQAKKLTVLAKIPNELFHFAAIPVEALVREDMAKVIGLKMDLQLLEGVGSTVAPKGLINYSNITTVTNTGTAADANSGYTVQPKDIYDMIGAVEEQNAQFKSFIMRPLLWSTLVNRRADAITAADQKGPFLFNITRDHGMADDLGRDDIGSLCGYRVFKSTQLSKTRTRGTGTTNNTYIVGGDFNDYLVGMGPALEFALNVQGDTAFATDQTWFRGVMYYDGAPRHEASFAILDNLLQNT